jgi:hypothetical protein
MRFDVYGRLQLDVVHTTHGYEIYGLGAQPCGQHVEYASFSCPCPAAWHLGVKWRGWGIMSTLAPGPSPPEPSLGENDVRFA